jgi:hypothetical protein
MSSTTLQAQIPATLPDVWVSDVTTTNSYIPDPIIDDVVVNSDMITDVNSDLPIKAIAWDEGARSQTTHLYFEDGAGNRASFPYGGRTINGHRPDIVLGNDINNPTQNYRAAVVYVDQNDYIHVQFYTLKNAGTPNFEAVFSNSIPLAKEQQSLPYYDTDPLPHIDMWSEPTTSITGSNGKSYHALYEWVATWSEPYLGTTDVYYAQGHINGGALVTPRTTLSSFAAHSGISDMSDVACYTEIATGRKRAAFCYTYQKRSNLVVTEIDMTVPGSHFLYDSTHLTANWVLFPRIEAMSLYTSLLEPARWEVVTIEGQLWGLQHPYCYTNRWGNPATAVPLATLPSLQSLNIKSPCIAGGLRHTSGATAIGNKQFTAGYYPWATQDLYVRDIDPMTGLPANTNHFIVNMNPLAPAPSSYNLADASKSFALSTCSNTGDYLLSTWYDGQDDGTGAGGNIWMKLSPNASTMQFKPTIVGTVNKTELILYPNPATSYICLSQSEGYTIYSLSGGVIQNGKAEQQQPINIQRLAKGNYILQTSSGKTIHFTKL